MNSPLKKLHWIEELLPNEVVQKNMHGGVGYYLDEKLVLILIETSRSTEYEGVSYPFEIWNGCFFLIEKIKQSTVFLKFQFLENHPATDKWLYLPAETEEFEELIAKVIRELKKRNPLFGTRVKVKSPPLSLTRDENNDISKPRLFSDQPPPQKPENLEINSKESKKPIAKIKSNKKPVNGFLLSVLKRRSR
jgi:hypothetical protein